MTDLTELARAAAHIHLTRTCWAEAQDPEPEVLEQAARDTAAQHGITDPETIARLVQATADTLHHWQQDAGQLTIHWEPK